MSDATDERRREPRIPTHIEVDYTAENTFLFAHIKDISTMGIFVRTDEPLDVGAELDLRFTPPEATQHQAGSEPFELHGEVVWNTVSGSMPGDPGMGVRFTRLSREERSRLMDLVHAIAYLDDMGGG
jgi:type IV pilus assembly protein PilZ